MTRARQTTAVTVDGYTRFCLGALVVLLTLLIIGIWATDPIPPSGQVAGAAVPPARTHTADGGRTILPNAGAQRLAILKAIQATNQKLDLIKSVLESGKVQVVIAELPAQKERATDVKKPPPR